MAWYGDGRNVICALLSLAAERARFLLLSKLMRVALIFMVALDEKLAPWRSKEIS